MSQTNYAFRDWAAYLDFLDSSNIQNHWDGEDVAFLPAGHRGIEALRRLAHEGWADGMANVRAIAMPLVESVVSRRASGAEWTMDVCGASYDLGEYLSGAPEHWQTTLPETSKPVITIQVDMGLRASIPGEMVTRRGAGVVALIMALQAAGYVVDAAAICGSGVESTHYWVRVPLVDVNGGALDTDRLLFALAHPAMVRMGLFQAGSWAAGHTYGHATREGGTCPWSSDLNLRRIHTDAANWANTASVTRWLHETFNNLTQEPALAGA